MWKMLKATGQYEVLPYVQMDLFCSKYSNIWISKNMGNLIIFYVRFYVTFKQDKHNIFPGAN